MSGTHDPLFDHAMTCFSQPQIECNSTLFLEKSPFTWPWLSDPDPLLSSPVDLGCKIGHGVYSDYHNIGAAYADETTCIVSQPEVVRLPLCYLSACFMRANIRIQSSTTLHSGSTKTRSTETPFLGMWTSEWFSRNRSTTLT